MRRETSPEALSQLVESVHDVFDSTLPSVLNRTARERREPGAENHARVEQIGVGDDAFGKARARFVDERQHESVLEVPIRAQKTVGLLRAAAQLVEACAEPSPHGERDRVALAGTVQRNGGDAGSFARNDNVLLSDHDRPCQKGSARGAGSGHNKRKIGYGTK